MKSTKLLYLIVLIVGLLSSCGFTASNMTRGGFYIAGFDYLYCTSKATCIHEQAHRMDAQRGFISSTPEYQLAIQSYAMNNPDKLWSSQILNYRGSMNEMYAQMYESVSGKIDLLPIELQRFYY